MNDCPLVTVVVPARNESSAIAAAIEAISNQTYPSSSIEVVLVVGDSTDDTAEIAAKVLADCAFARWAVLENTNGTTPSNLNRGLAWAEGDILVRVDARSLIPPDYVGRCVRVLAEPSRVVVGGSQVAVERSAHWRDAAIARALNHRYAMGGSRYRRVGAPSGPADTVYLGSFRTSQLRSVGGWNERFTTNQDFELNRRMASLGSIWFEAGLPVSYLPRRTHREIAQQYHRFGRWKVRYWRSTNDRPQRRQWLLIVLPAVGLVGFVAALLGFDRRVAALTIPAVAAGCGVIDGLGGQTAPASIVVRLAAGATNLLVGCAWWTGIVREQASRRSRSR